MFFQNLCRHEDNIALIEGESKLTYRELANVCEGFKQGLPEGPALGFVLCQNDIDTVVAYLGCLQQQLPVLMLDRDTDEFNLQRLIDTYHPQFLVKDGQVLLLETSDDTLDQRLAILLSTSGSTGSPKQVALSRENLNSNAEAIAEYLHINGDDVAISSLPLFYSYGLSVLNSHLSVGAAMVVTKDSLMTRPFWNSFSEHGVTNLAGVPHSYQMLIKLGFFRKHYPHLRYLTQAGGRLDPKSVDLLAHYAKEHGVDFYVMYGQTEATARIAFLRPEKALLKPNSIGQAIPGGMLYLIDPETKKSVDSPDTVGELVYRGPNVMLGYVNRRIELQKVSPSNELHTGDLAYFDQEGDYFIAGRLKRIVKILGKRTNLDDVEQLISEQLHSGHSAIVRVVGNDERLDVVSTDKLSSDLAKELSSKLGLHSSFIHCHQMTDIPMTDSGKVDYAKLENILKEGE